MREIFNPMKISKFKKQKILLIFLKFICVIYLFRQGLVDSNGIPDFAELEENIKPENFNFESFKRRNKELKKDSQKQENFDNKNSEELESMDQTNDQIILNQLRNFINNDQYPVDLKQKKLIEIQMK